MHFIPERWIFSVTWPFREIIIMNFENGYAA